MANNETFLPSKLTSQKTRIILIIAIIIPVITIVLGISSNTCGIDHVMIISDIAKYQQTQDPEFCEKLVYRIDTFIERCGIEIEILDCS